jgi:hypothetical protein
MKRFLALALTAIALVACQEPPATTGPASLTLANKPPLRLNVAAINIVENYRAPMKLPHVDHTLPTPPIVALKQWAGQRFVAAGAQGALEITVDDASVVETLLAKKDGLTGFFTDDQEARYDAHIKITLRLYDGVNTISVAEANAEVARWRTINEKATVTQREALFNGMLQEMMLQLDGESEARIRQYFGRFIVG